VVRRVAGGVDPPLPDEDVSAFGELAGADAHAGRRRGGGGAVVGEAPGELAKSPSVRGARSVPGKERGVTWPDARAEFARRPEDFGSGVARARRAGVSSTSNASALLCSSVVTSASLEVVAVRPPRTHHNVGRHRFYAVSHSNVNVGRH
jgi:hypothetical protein